jgi:ABC-type uncharacterized transport system fused permease/ATPase subunit
MNQQAFDDFGRAVAGFALLGIPAAIVNAGLKFGQAQIQLSFQQHLGLTLHRAYTRNRAYYAASTLGGLTHADQRITEDVERFASSLAELYNKTLKPLLDVILFTRSLARVMGYSGQVGVERRWARVGWRGARDGGMGGLSVLTGQSGLHSGAVCGALGQHGWLRINRRSTL